MLLMKMRSIALVAIVLVSLLSTSYAALGDTQPATIRRPFSTAQWSELMRLRHSAIVLPANIPSGYRVVSMEVNRNVLTLGGESYRITYSNGSNAIEWYVSNVTAGGDAPPESFRAQYNSAVLGRGVIVYQNDMDDPILGQLHKCWLTGPPVANLIPGESYGMTACGSAFSAQAIAGMMSSMYLVPPNHAPRATNNIWPDSMQKKKWVEWTLVKSGNRYVLDSVAYPETDDPCSDRVNTPNDPRVVAVRTYYEDWGDNRLNEAWGMLSATYHRQNNHDAWLGDHKSVRDIGAVTVCPLSTNSVAAWIWWVDK